ncbi:hypothetical protein GCM10017687_10570 [Streptomyces echinatus]|uniref:hypothetical protein n=1 Tax=Streptomyces echinatus TaxID=67293 RepID=UPI0031E86602
MAWPTAVARREDGTLLLTTSLAFAQKALNVRRDGRVALLFSDPTGSGLDRAPQVFVSGRAHCPDAIMTGPEGAEEYWRRLFERQPHSRAYLKRPMRPVMSWYYLRLLITVEPERVSIRPSLEELPWLEAPAPAAATQTLPGAAQLGRMPTAVLAGRGRLGGTAARPYPPAADTVGLSGRGSTGLPCRGRGRPACWCTGTTNC